MIGVIRSMKRIQFILWVVLATFLLCPFDSFAQDLKVVSFQLLERDILARANKRFDVNDEPCAVVRVSVPDAKDYSFGGNVIGEVLYRPGEAIVYMAHGSTSLTIISDKFGTMKYDFGQRLKEQTTYKLVLKYDVAGANKTRTLVMPVAGVGSTPSYGLMVGIVKKFGGYIKAKYNFANQSTEGECTGEGVDAMGHEVWFSGETKGSRLSVTVGAMFRLSKPLYLYAGGGYGYKKLAWETVDGQWLENTDETYQGVEAETGLVLRLKNFALSAGVQSNSFKYMEATVGIGIMF